MPTSSTIIGRPACACVAVQRSVNIVRKRRLIGEIISRSDNHSSLGAAPRKGICILANKSTARSCSVLEVDPNGTRRVSVAHPTFPDICGHDNIFVRVLYLLNIVLSAAGTSGHSLRVSEIV